METKRDQPDVYIYPGREKQKRREITIRSERFFRSHPAASSGPAAVHGWAVELLQDPTCNIIFDLMNLADGVVAPKHVQVEGLGVFSHAGPDANVRSCPPGGENIIRTE